MGLLTNSVSLIGRVGKYKECKAFETGGMLCTINIGVKTGEKWNNLFIDFFQHKNKTLSRGGWRICKRGRIFTN